MNFNKNIITRNLLDIYGAFLGYSPRRPIFSLSFLMSWAQPTWRSLISVPLFYFCTSIQAIFFFFGLRYCRSENREQYLRIFNHLAYKNSVFAIFPTFPTLLYDTVFTSNYYVIVMWVQNKSKDMNDYRFL